MMFDGSEGKGEGEEYVVVDLLSLKVTTSLLCTKTSPNAVSPVQNCDLIA